MTHNERRDWVGRAMADKGFHDDLRFLPHDVMFRATLAQTEVCEAVQEVKRHWGRAGTDQEVVKDDVAEECADAAIRLYDLAHVAGLDLDAAGDVPGSRDAGGDERCRLVNRLGKVSALVGEVFHTAEGAWDYSETPDGDLSYVGGAVAHVTTALSHLEAVCRRIGRDLYAAIDEKMAVNVKRPRLYGTPGEGGR